MTNRVAIAATVAVLVLSAGFVAVLWRLGLLTVTGTEPNAKLIVASLTVLGAFLGALLTLFGVVIRASIDERAESRLKLEAATKAVKLLTTDAGTLAPLPQRAGALFTLSSLGLHDLTLALTADLLSRSEIQPHTVAKLLDAALKEGNARLQETSISMLVEYPAQMLTDGGVELPSFLTDGCVGLPDFVRGWCPIVVGRMMISRPLLEWAGDRRFSAHAAVASLATIWTKEKHPQIRSDAGAIFAALRRSIQNIPDRLYSPSGVIDIAKVTTETATIQASTHASTHLVEQIDAWSKPHIRATAT